MKSANHNQSKKFRTLVFCASLSSCLLLAGSMKDAWAGGFGYNTEANPVNPAGSQGASGLENASAVFYNPAAVMRLDNQVFTQAELAIYNPKFQDKGSELVPNLRLTGGSASGRSETLIPSLAASYRISEDFAVGLSVNAPFGLETLYPNNWAGRYQAIDSKLSTININPAVAAKVTDDLSLGVGINLQYADVDLSNAIDFGSLLALGGFPPVPQQLDGLIELKGSDWSWGWNAGILYEPTETTRVGLAYRSPISHTLKGNANFTVPQAAAGLKATGAFTDTSVTSNLDLPDILSFGITQQVSPQIAIAGQIDWQIWSRYSENRVDFENPAQPDTVDPQNWHDTFRFAVSTIYDPSDRLRVRLGVAYDPSPVKDEFLTPRIPSSDAIFLDIGATYRPTENLALTARWNHVFFTARDINRTVPGAGTLVGKYNSSFDAFSLVLEYKF